MLGKLFPTLEAPHPSSKNIILVCVQDDMEGHQHLRGLRARKGSSGGARINDAWAKVL